MDRLSTDLLEMIFRNLESREMVKNRRVEKRFLQTIDESKRNWRSLVIPIKIEDWDPAILEMFDEKSGSTIRELSLKINSGRVVELDRLVPTLCKSKGSLFSVSIQAPNHLINFFKEIRLKIHPVLVDLRMIELFTELRPKVSLIIKEQIDATEEPPNKGLRVLWSPQASYCEGKAFQNLTSLSIEEHLSAEKWRQLLEGPSKTLKHLRIFIYQRTGMLDLEGIELPRLQVLQFRITWEGLDAYVFPSWLRLPFSCKLLLEQIHVASGLPSVSELWIGGDGWIDEMNWANQLGGRCPLLETLRFDSTRVKFITDPLLNLLRKRQENVEAGLEVDGVKMISLKRLVVHLPIVNKDQLVLLEVQELVAEIVDLESVPEKIELEV